MAKNASFFSNHRMTRRYASGLCLRSMRSRQRKARK